MIQIMGTHTRSESAAQSTKGRSDDGTRERLAQRCAADPRLRWVDNPGRIVSTGLNACLREARGSVIARLEWSF